MQQISESELELMRIIWANNGLSFYAQIFEEINLREKGWNKSTVLTFLSRLVDKKMLSIKKHGRRNEYIAHVTEEEYMKEQTKSFVNKVFEGEALGLVSTLIQQSNFTADEIARINKIWNGGKDIK